MRYNSTADMQRLRRASLGPVAATSQRQYALPVPGRGLAGLAHQTGSRATLRGFGALGTGTTTSVVGGAAQGASVGAVAGPVGAAVGAVVGAVAGLFTGKSNPQIQIDKTSAVTYFSQYVNVAGTVAGRTIGINNMDMVFRGACFEGHFPKWGNKTELPDSLMSMPGSPYGNNDNCFAVLWSAAKLGKPAPGGSGKNTGNGGVPVRDALTFVNNYVWPSNTADVDTNPWATTTDSIGRQIIIDAADAYLAVQDPTTYPVIGTSVSAPTNAIPATPSQPAQTASATPSPVATSSSGSPDGTYTTSPGGSVTSATGVVFTITTTPDGTGNYQLNVGGQTTGIGRVLLKTNGQMYAGNTNGWYVWNPSAGWQLTNEPQAAVSLGMPPQLPALTGSSAAVSTTPPAIGASISAAMDAVTGQMVGVPSGATYGGLTAAGAWIVVYAAGQNAGTYTLQSGVLVAYTAPGGTTTAAAGTTVSSTPPALGAALTYLRDNASGAMISIPAGGTYAGLTSTGGWLVSYPSGGSIPAGTYDANNGSLTLYSAGQINAVGVPAGYSITTQSVLLNGTQYPIYSDAVGNLYVWTGTTMVPYTSAATTAASTTSTGGGGGGSYYSPPSSPDASSTTPLVATAPTSDNSGLLLLGAAALGAYLLMGGS